MATTAMECAAHNFAAFEHHKHFLTNRMAQTVVFNSEKPVTEYKKAAVLFLMREQCGRLEVLLTKRSDKVTSHIGKPLACKEQRTITAAL